VTLPYNTSQVTRLGCRPVLTTQLGQNYYANNISTFAGSEATPWAVEFDYFGPTLALRFRNAVALRSTFWVWVDDAPTTAVPSITPANAAGSLFYYQLTWGAARTRRVRIYLEHADFGGLDIGPTDTVAATPKPQFALAVVGDSYTAGTAATTALQAFPFTLGRMLGARSIRQASPVPAIATRAPALSLAIQAGLPQSEQSPPIGCWSAVRSTTTPTVREPSRPRRRRHSTRMSPPSPRDRCWS